MQEKKPLTLNTILLAVILIGLIVLYILFFTQKYHGLSSTGPVEQVEGTTGMRIVFVNIDSLNAHYEFLNVLKANLENTGERMQNEVLSQQNELEREASAFQQKIASNAISEDKAKIEYENLMQKQQALLEKKDRYSQQIAEQEYNMNLQLLDSVTNFLKRFNQTHGYDYIMGYKTAGEILIAKDTFDITSEVLDLLNQEYQKSKK